MKRSLADWLLLPLFLFPVAAGAGFCVDARQRYLAEIGEYATDGARIAAAWLEGEPLGDTGFFRPLAPDSERFQPSGERIPFRVSDREGVVWLGPNLLPAGEWNLAREYPVGLSARALGSSEVRLAIETGVTPARAGEVDEATACLAALHSLPDPDRLRTAPLPAMSKLFLVLEWQERGQTFSWLPDAKRLLTILADLQRASAIRGLPDQPGEHEVGGLPVLVAESGRPIAILPRDHWPGFSFLNQVHGPEGRAAILVLAIPASSPVEIAGMPLVWRGRLDKPVAGEWRLYLPWGYDWWRSPYFKQWAGPVLGGVLLFLTIPAALLLSLRRRRKLDEARARFITELAHDLRTPLTSLRLHAEMLAEGRAPEEKREKYVEIVARESSRVSGLLANLLDLSRLERGRRDLKVERLDLDETLEPVLSDFVMLYPARRDDLAVAGVDGLTVLADQTALTRCLLNLLDNVGKFTTPGVAIRIGWSADGADRVIIRVEDEGPGIAPAERGGLFKRYERGRRAKRDGIPGTGLGLSLVAELCENMGGTARFVPGERGAAFELVLPGGES